MEYKRRIGGKRKMLIARNIVGLLFVLLFIPSIVSASQILVTNTDDNTIALIDTENATETKLLDVPDGPSKLIVTPDNTKAITTLRRGNAIAIIDLVNWKLDSTITVGRKPIDLVQVGNTVYVANSNGDEVVAVDLATKKLSKRIPVKVGPTSLAAFTTNNVTKLAVLNRGTQSISILNTATNVVEEEINLAALVVGGDPVLVGVKPDGSALFVADNVFAKVYSLEQAQNYALSIKEYRMSSVTEYNQIIAGNKYLIISHNVKREGEILVTNLEDQSSYSIQLKQWPRGIDIKNGVVYAANGNVVTMINRETNIEKDFTAGKGVTGVVVLNENYAPIGDDSILTQTEGSDEAAPAGTGKEVTFPWKRVIILSIILVIIFIFLKTRREEENESNKSSTTQGESSSSSANTSLSTTQLSGSPVRDTAQTPLPTTLQKAMTEVQQKEKGSQTSTTTGTTPQEKVAAPVIKKAKISKEKSSHKKRKAKRTQRSR